MTKAYGTNGEESSSLRLIDDNKKAFKFFKVFGLFHISYEKGKFKVHEKACMISRILWFLWHFTGMAIIMWIRVDYHDHCFKVNITNAHPNYSMTNDINDCSEDLGDLDIFLIGSIGILMFILIDPVQTIILKRNMNFIPEILKEIKYLENINLGNRFSRNYNVSKIFFYKKSERELKIMKSNSSEGFTNFPVGDSPDSSTTTPHPDGICDSDLPENMQNPILTLNDEDQLENDKFSKYYNMLWYSILGFSILMFLLAFGYGVYSSVRHQDVTHDIKDEWKFIGSIFFLVFPVVTTWFCVFFIGYQRKMYKALNVLPDDHFYNDKYDKYIKDIGNYFETMQKISKMLCDRIYRFTFGINFALFVIIGTMSTFELIQGIGEIKKKFRNEKGVTIYERKEFGDIIYVFPIAVCVFHIFLSCQHSSTLVTGQYEKLRYKLKGIMTSLLVDELEMSKTNEKKFKRVELLYKNLKDCNPQPEVYGGFKVNYPLLSGMLLFIFTYSRVFYGYVGVPNLYNGQEIDIV